MYRDLVQREKEAKNEIQKKFIDELNLNKKNNNKINEEKNKPQKKIFGFGIPNIVGNLFGKDNEKTQEEKIVEEFEKKRKIINYYAFFKLNKDRANIYKKKNDLRKLQMAYFGGRFLNTKINPEIFSDENHLNDLVDNYFLKQEHEQYNNNKKIRLKNYKKNSVFYISANKSMKDKVSFPWKRDKSREKNCF